MFPDKVLQYLDRTTDLFPLKMHTSQFESFKAGFFVMFKSLSIIYYGRLYEDILSKSGNGALTLQIIFETFADAWDYRASLLNERVFVFFLYYTARLKLQRISRIQLN